MREPRGKEIHARSKSYLQIQMMWWMWLLKLKHIKPSLAKSLQLGMLRRKPSLFNQLWWLVKRKVCIKNLTLGPTCYIACIVHCSIYDSLRNIIFIAWYISGIGRTAKAREWEIVVMWLPPTIKNEILKQNGLPIELLPEHRVNYVTFPVQFMTERRQSKEEEGSTDKRYINLDNLSNDII